MDKRVVGVQENGSSPTYTKRMALEAKAKAIGGSRIGTAADVGGGSGDLANILAPFSERVVLLDYNPPHRDSLPVNVAPIEADLNQTWPIKDCSVDFAFSTECIEHVENPRHFLREMARIVVLGGYVFISTPNNHSLSSKITFMISGQHRLFQSASYPAHITPLLKCDFERMGREVGFVIQGCFYSGQDTVPRVRWPLRFGGSLFSDSIGILFKSLGHD